MELILSEVMSNALSHKNQVNPGSNPLLHEMIIISQREEDKEVEINFLSR
jgi:hypothetical protein